MKHNKAKKLKMVSIESGTTSSSLVARAGQIMAIIITLSLISMISSMLISENLSGDAAQINQAGALRMQAMRISRASFIDPRQFEEELKTFEMRLNRLFPGGVIGQQEDLAIKTQFQKISTQWLSIKNQELNTSIEELDEFANSLDQLVTLMQFESEKELSFLRSIQGIGLFSILIISFVVLILLNRTIITPLKQLVKVAEEAGKGNFELKSEYSGDDELGVLAHTINQMSDELKSTYQDFEQRVDDKTKELTRSNRSLEVLYFAASSLASDENQHTEEKIVSQLESVLGLGKISIEKISANADSQTIEIKTVTDTTQICFERLEFPLKKQEIAFGQLVWQLPKNQVPLDWQEQLLQTMADIIATQMELEKKRNLDDRLLIVEERAVIARELHDSLAQSLSYLKVQTSLLTKKMQKGLSTEQIGETIEDIKEGLNSAYQQLRELLTTFRLKLDDPSLESALQGTVAEFSAKCEHPVKLNFQLAANSLSANQEIHVLQIVREALSNVQRHARAQKAGVSLINVEGKVCVEIWDDGKGLSQKSEQRGHFGLGIMQERAKSLHSSIQLIPRKPQGTRVILQFQI